MLKYLRIAVTALSLTACVLIVAMWVRSNYSLRTFYYVSDSSRFKALSCAGKVFVNWGYVRMHLPVNDMAGRERARNRVMEYDMRTDRESGPCPIPETNAFGFNLSNRHSFVIPFWFLTTLTVSVAVAPWIHWSKRFSLRTLLIATTLIAVGLGVLVELAAPTS